MTTTREVPLPPVTAMSLERSGDEALPVSARFGIEDGVASGHVEWAATCRRTLTEQARTQTVTETRGSRAAGIATAVGAGVLGTATLAWLAGSAAGGAVCEGLSNIPSDGPPEASDCHESAAVPALLGVTSLALLMTSLVLFKSPPTTTPGPISLGPPSPPRVVADAVACNTGAVSGLAVALYRADERVAAASTDAAGNFAVRLPPGTAGSLVLVVDAIAADTTLLRQGDVLAHAEATAP